MNFKPRSSLFLQIAASYGRKICIFEPAPLYHQESSHVSGTTYVSVVLSCATTWDISVYMLHDTCPFNSETTCTVQSVLCCRSSITSGTRLASWSQTVTCTSCPGIKKVRNVPSFSSHYHPVYGGGTVVSARINCTICVNVRNNHRRISEY